MAVRRAHIQVEPVTPIEVSKNSTMRDAIRKVLDDHEIYRLLKVKYDDAKSIDLVTERCYPITPAEARDAGHPVIDYPEVLKTLEPKDVNLHWPLEKRLKLCGSRPCASRPDCDCSKDVTDNLTCWWKMQINDKPTGISVQFQ